MGKIKSMVTCAGQVEIVTVEEFAQKLLDRDQEKISNAIVDVEILGLENDGKPPVIKNTHIDYSVDTPFASIGDYYEMFSEWKTEVIKLPVLETEPINAISKQLEKIILFEESKEHENPKRDFDKLAQIVEDLSLRSLENFGEPDHFIDFGDGKYAIATLKDLKIETCVYNKQVRAGIISERKSLYGIKTKEIK